MSGASNLELQCHDLQNDEIAVLESIYPDNIQVLPNPTNKPGQILNLEIKIALPTPLATQIHVPPSQPGGSIPPPSLSLEHLPPISVRLYLPPIYPLETPAKVVSIRASLPNSTEKAGQGNWLNRKILQSIGDKLNTLWAENKESNGEGTGTIWSWWEWVASGDCLSDLELLQDGILQLPIPPHIAPSSFHTILKSYNASQLHSSFEATAFSCSICLENRKGKSCIQMPGCSCVFCTPCLQSCWTLAISEGTLENVSCPSVSCVKKRALKEPQKLAGEMTELSSPARSAFPEVDPVLVESIVGVELRKRWESLKDMRIAEIDPTYTICPQPKCQAPVPAPSAPSAADLAYQATLSARAIRLPSSRSLPTPPATPNDNDLSPSTQMSEDRWARYRCCPRCTYSFCLYCSSTWHGPHTACNFPQTSAIVQEYLSYPENGPDRARMEMTRGKANLERMVAKWKEDEENKKWLEAKTRACAGCGVRVEKSHGCNHMTCGRCNAHFCYRCGSSLKPTDPYAHYNRPGTSCFEKLFDQDEVDRFERETAMGIAGLQVEDDVDVGAWGGVQIWDRNW